jgi:hypothetical protein
LDAIQHQQATSIVQETIYYTVFFIRVEQWAFEPNLFSIFSKNLSIFNFNFFFVEKLGRKKKRKIDFNCTLGIFRVIIFQGKDQQQLNVIQQLTTTISDVFLLISHNISFKSKTKKYLYRSIDISICFIYTP